MKKIGKIALLLAFVGVSMAFGAGEFDEFNSVVTETDTAAKDTVGIVGTWIVGLLPVLGLAVGIFGGNKFLHKQTNGQEENFAKQIGYSGVGGVLGLLVSIIIIAAVGAGLMGDSELGFTVLNEFWKGVFGV